MPLVGHKIETTSDNFGYLVRNNCLLADKTLFIKEFVDAQNVFLIIRQRRSGKSLNLSMLQHFFSATVAGESTAGLFDQFLIAKEDNGEFLKKHQGKYPVIFISFKDIKTTTYAKALVHMRSLIKELYREHKHLLTFDSVDENDRNTFNAYLNGTFEDGELQRSLRFLSDFLFRVYGKKTIILIDEYDSPLTSAYQERSADPSFLNQMSLFMRDMFSEALKTTTSLEKGLMTGILRISKNDMLSGLNNPKTYSLLSNKYSQYFGFTESEVTELLAQVRTNDSLEDIKAFYNGYLMGETVIYNPWSFMNYLDDKELAPYWVLSAGDKLLKELFLKSDDDTKEKLADLMRGESIEGWISLKLHYEELMTEPHALWTLLLFTGYLTVVRKERKDDFYICQLRIPNREVLAQYRGIFNVWLEKSLGGLTQYNSFLKNLVEGHVEKFTQSLQNYLIHSLSFRDVVGDNKAENFYHGFFAGLVASIEDTHDLRSNRESGDGLYDIILKPKDARYSLGVILEFKHVKKNQSMKKMALTALTQMNQNGYIAELTQCKYVTRILKIGIAFRDKSVVTVHKMEDVSRKI